MKIKRYIAISAAKRHVLRKEMGVITSESKAIAANVQNPGLNGKTGLSIKKWKSGFSTTAASFQRSALFSSTEPRNFPRFCFYYLFISGRQASLHPLAQSIQQPPPPLLHPWHADPDPLRTLGLRTPIQKQPLQQIPFLIRQLPNSVV